MSAVSSGCCRCSARPRLLKVRMYRTVDQHQRAALVVQPFSAFLIRCHERGRDVGDARADLEFFPGAAVAAENAFTPQRYPQVAGRILFEFPDGGGSPGPRQLHLLRVIVRELQQPRGRTHPETAVAAGAEEGNGPLGVEDLRGCAVGVDPQQGAAAAHIEFTRTHRARRGSPPANAWVRRFPTQHWLCGSGRGPGWSRPRCCPRHLSTKRQRSPMSVPPSRSAVPEPEGPRLSRPKAARLQLQPEDACRAVDAPQGTVVVEYETERSEVPGRRQIALPGRWVFQ